jgi:hypothetical protein
MKAITFILNLPWSLLGLLCGLLSLPQNIRVDRPRSVVIINVKRLWMNEIFLWRGVRGLTLGNTMLLSKLSNNNTYNHEIIHVRQFMKMPLIFPALYLTESLWHGYKNNKYEIEAHGLEIDPESSSG